MAVQRISRGFWTTEAARKTQSSDTNFSSAGTAAPVAERTFALASDAVYIVQGFYHYEDLLGRSWLNLDLTHELASVSTEVPESCFTNMYVSTEIFSNFRFINAFTGYTNAFGSNLSYASAGKSNARSLVRSETFVSPEGRRGRRFRWYKDILFNQPDNLISGSRLGNANTPTQTVVQLNFSSGANISVELDNDALI